MLRSMRIFAVLFLLAIMLVPSVMAESMEIAGVTFEKQKAVEGKDLALNGVALRKALGIIKVFAGGLYLETPSKDAKEVVESQQIKHVHLTYLTSKATSKKLKDGFLKAITKANPPEEVAAQQENIDTYASWLDTDMKPGGTSSSTYVPGKGLTFWVNGEEKGMIADDGFAKIYYRYLVGEKADSALRKGYLGL